MSQALAIRTAEVDTAALLHPFRFRYTDACIHPVILGRKLGRVVDLGTFLRGATGCQGKCECNEDAGTGNRLQNGLEFRASIRVRSGCGETVFHLLFHSVFAERRTAGPTYTN